MKRKILALALLALSASGCSSGAHRHHDDNSETTENPGKAVIAAMDTNGDNQVSWQENHQYFEKLFTRLDAAHKGYVTEADFKAINDDPLFNAMPFDKLQISFAMFDRNDDGKLSHDEFEHMGDRIFTLLDRNMDGVISESDFKPEGCSRDDSSGDSKSKGRGASGGGGSMGRGGGF